MKITALAPWFGSKRTLAPRIIEALGPHKAYWEPFCGSMAVLLAKPRVAMETVNDLHGDLVNLARVVQSDELAPSLFSRVERTAFSEDLFAIAASRWRSRGVVPAADEPDIDRAYDYLVASWMGRNGTAGVAASSCNFCARYTDKGGSPTKRFQSMADSIPAWWNRLRNVTILNRDTFGILDRIADDSGTAIYLDPPYWEKGARYVHDFDSVDGSDVAGLFGATEPRKVNHHRLLAETLSRFTKARVVVSYYDHPAVRELYPEDAWEWIDCSMTKAMVNQGKRDGGGATKAPEVLICNRRGV